MPHLSEPIIRRVSNFDLRRLFNEGQFWERVQTGELQAVVIKERPSTIESENIPAGSTSQEVFYYDQNNNEVARIQQFVKPDGSIGASGLPDPKRLYIKGTVYRIVKEGNQVPALTDEEVANILGE